MNASRDKLPLKDLPLKDLPLKYLNEPLDPQQKERGVIAPLF